MGGANFAAGGDWSTGLGGSIATGGGSGATHSQGGAGGNGATSIRLCSWNIRKLGHGTTKDYAAVTTVLEENCDAAVVVEVMQKGGTYPGFKELMRWLGSSWTGVVTAEPRPNTTSGNSEFYAVVWRSETIHECDGWNGLYYVEDNDGSGTETVANKYAREPAYGCFVLEGPEGRLDFLLAAYHATWASGSTTTIQSEVAHIDASVAEMRASRAGEKDVLVLGDFNLVPEKLAEVTTMTDHTVGESSRLNRYGDLTSNLYDHVLVYESAATPELGSPAAVLDVRSVSATPATFYSQVSDHLPIRTTLTLVGADDD